MKQITFIKRSGDWVLWCVGNYQYQFENKKEKKKEVYNDTSFEEAIEIFDYKFETEGK